jgi:acyl dehydratase
MSGPTVRDVGTVPRLSRLYLKALFGRLSGTDARDGFDDALLPDVRLVVRDVAVDRAALAAYDEVCGFRRGDLVPATYGHLVAFPLAMRLMTDRDFPFPTLGLVHLRNRIVQLRPVRADELLTVTVSTRGPAPHRRGSQFDLVAELRASGQVVLVERSTYLHRHRAADGREWAPPDPARADPVVGLIEGGRDDGLPGVATARWSLAADLGRRYAAVSGDRNPIHLHPLTARLFGFRRPVMHGMWTVARCLAVLEGRLPDAYEVDVKFIKPLLLPSDVDFTARRSGPGWRFAVTDPRSGAPHLTGGIRPLR